MNRAAVVIVASLLGVPLACLESKSGTSDEEDLGVDARSDVPAPDGAVAETGGGDDAADAAEPDASRPDTTRPDANEPDAAEPDTNEPDAAPSDTRDPIVEGLPPGGPWQRWTIGGCIDFRETLSWSPDGEAAWTIEDHNACYEPSPPITLGARASSPGAHVLELELDPPGDMTWTLPSQVTWTWAVLPGDPATLSTAAFRRVGQSARFLREDREVRGSDGERAERHLRVELHLRGYPEVREMSVDFEVSWRFASRPDDERGGSGRLGFPARRVTTADGRVAIAAEGFDPNEHPDHYRFQQLLLERFDGHTVDLIAEAFFPVLYEVEGDPASLVFERWDRIWTEARP